MKHVKSMVTRRMGQRAVLWSCVILLGTLMATDGMAQRGGGRGGGRGGARGGAPGGGQRMAAPVVAVVKARDGKSLTLTLPNGREQTIKLPDNTRVSRMEPMELKKLSQNDNINVSGPTSRTGGFKVEAKRIEVLPIRTDVGPSEERANRRMLDQAEKPRSSRLQTIGMVISTDPLKIKTERQRIYTVITSDETQVFRTTDSKIGDIQAEQRLRLIRVPGEKQGELRAVSITLMPNQE